MADDEAPPPRRPPPAALARKSAPAQPWSHVETMHLLDAYEERWTALRRGQLKAHQWEEVAAEVAARCAAATPGAAAHRKTGTQCRHKLEKLRKRYRTEGARPVTSLWPYFRRMDQLERGPLAASSYPPAAGSPPADGEEDEEEEEEEEDDDDEEDVEEEENEDEELVPRNNTRSINGIIREFGTGLAPRHPQLQLHQPPPPPPSSITPSTAPPRKRVAYEAFQARAAAAAAAAAAVKVKDEDDDEEAAAVEMARRGGSSGRSGAAQLSAVLRDFGEGVMRLERRRMEVQWEIERGWQEVDARHARMLQDAQRQLRDTVAAACALPPKKARRDHGDS